MVCARRHRRLLRRSLRKARGRARRAAPAKAGGTSRSLPPRRARRGANHNHRPCRWVSFTTKSPLPRRWRGPFLFYARFALGRALLWGFAGRGTWRGRRPVCPAGPACAGKCKPAAAKSRARGTAATVPRARRSVFQTMRISSIRQGRGVCAAGHMPRFRPVSPGGQITPPALRPLPLRARRTRRRAGPALPGAAPPRAGRCPPG